MKVKNISQYILEGLGTDGVYYSLMPGDEGIVHASVVTRQQWIGRGVAEQVKAEKKSKPAKKEPVKKEKKEVEPEGYNDDLVF
jgi:hypothetical protein